MVVSSSSGTNPPQAAVKLGNQTVKPTINGYQWSNGHSSTVADVAFAPAKGLKKYQGHKGEKVTLAFDTPPKTLSMTMWVNNKKRTASIKNAQFKLPGKPGDYTYEITGHWGKNYVNYDFAVHVD